MISSWGLALLHVHFIRFVHIRSIKDYQSSIFTTKKKLRKKKTKTQHIILNGSINFFPQFHRAGKGKMCPSSEFITECLPAWFLTPHLLPLQHSSICSYLLQHLLMCVLLLIGSNQKRLQGGGGGKGEGVGGEKRAM